MTLLFLLKLCSVVVGAMCGLTCVAMILEALYNYNQKVEFWYLFLITLLCVAILFI